MAKITWAGQACFQILFSNSKDHQASVVIDPFDEKIGLKIPNFEADVLLVTHQHHDHNNIKAVKPTNTAPGKAKQDGVFLVDGPGEYEIKRVYIQGIDSFHDDSEGKERGKNTIYVIESENMRFCHLGDLGQKQLTDEQLEKIGSIDVLMIPVGGTYTISFNESPKIIGQIEPKIVIPMHYQIPKLNLNLDDVDKFVKIMGKEAIEPQDKLVIKNGNLPKEGELQIFILKP